MCIQVVERFSVCRCLYYRHSIDPCAARSQRGHIIQEKIVLVGYACDQHSRRRTEPPVDRQPHPHPDSGYSSGGWSVHQDRFSVQ
ncbi:hypothetical protein EJ03DRAFT_270861 [Teratosphaeria nubilosa]|uniref:Uncharacterized protein n=1 Tax=Teratosphaeria nubilosa TaxID=161662 RepID=A0A6G1LBK6_9PEZI|nr:hypothetical protein EJ03DRAFT_270861 [Teratosphaeria nubilosa]